jgi:outer membrane protein TolC
VPVDTSFGTVALPALDDAISGALERRGDVEAARRSVERSRYQAQYARNASLPSFDVSAAVSATRLDSLGRTRFVDGRSRETEWFIGLEFSRPLLNSGARADVERAAAVEQQSALALVDAENAVRADVRAAFRDIALGREHARLATEAAQLARRQFDGERARLDLGLTDIFRVLQYEEQVAQVERAEVSAWLALTAANIRYRTAVGDAVQEYSR